MVARARSVSPGRRRFRQGGFHVALSVSVTDQTMLLYLDGVQDGVLTSTEMMTLQDRTLYVGYDFNYASSHFKGIIDEVRF